MHTYACITSAWPAVMAASGSVAGSSLRFGSQYCHGGAAQLQLGGVRQNHGQHCAVGKSVHTSTHTCSTCLCSSCSSLPFADITSSLSRACKFGRGTSTKSGQASKRVRKRDTCGSSWVLECSSGTTHSKLPKGRSSALHCRHKPALPQPLCPPFDMNHIPFNAHHTRSTTAARWCVTPAAAPESRAPWPSCQPPQLRSLGGFRAPGAPPAAGREAEGHCTVRATRRQR
jgi:hypothetical protein